MLLTCTTCMKNWLKGETDNGVCPQCKSRCVPADVEVEEGYRLPREKLPPFKCRIDAFGKAEVLIGYEANDGGRWAITNRDAEEAVRDLMQRATDATDDPYEEGAMDEFEGKIHFMLSHAVHMSWYIHVPKKSMDDLNALDDQRKLEVERRFSASSAEVPERIGKLQCPECGSADISMLEVREQLIKSRVHLRDGRISVDDVVDEDHSNVKSIRFECMACHEQWEAPAWIEQAIDDNSSEEWDEDADEPIDYTPTSRQGDLF
jgi:Zn finger protein HypA/HybF involved in hydrogenase expression